MQILNDGETLIFNKKSEYCDTNLVYKKDLVTHIPKEMDILAFFEVVGCLKFCVRGT